MICLWAICMYCEVMADPRRPRMDSPTGSKVTPAELMFTVLAGTVAVTVPPGEHTLHWFGPLQLAHPEIHGVPVGALELDHVPVPPAVVDELEHVTVTGPPVR